MSIESIIKRMPGVKQIVNKFESMKLQMQELSYINQIQANEIIDLRLKLKKSSHEKVNVVFVCHRPQVWESLRSVYESLKNKEIFDVKIVAIPNKKQVPKLGLNHEIYESEGAEDFWKKYGCIDGYNYATNQWLDLNSLEPDYIFFQQPYNITRCSEYKSWIVSSYAKLCYVGYFALHTLDDVYDECTPDDFFKNISFFFAQNSEEQELISRKFIRIDNKIGKSILTGFPRYDDAHSYVGCENNIWKNRSKNMFRLIWTPRWTTNEGNCHFFKYKDKFIEYCQQHDDIDFVFRPHPQAFSEWMSTGELSERQLSEYRDVYSNTPNMSIDESKTFLSLFYSSDCLVTDRSSVVLEYFLTGKPIIYCTSNGKHDTIDYISEGFYKVSNWEELESRLNELKNGHDELFEIRQQIIKERFYMPIGGAGHIISDILEQDAIK